MRIDEVIYVRPRLVDRNAFRVLALSTLLVGLIVAGLGFALGIYGVPIGVNTLLGLSFVCWAIAFGAMILVTIVYTTIVVLS